MMPLRPFQVEAMQAVLREFETQHSTLLVLPTGTGKTIVFSHLAKHYVDMGKKVLIIAHREELIQQACDKLMAATGLDAAVEKAKREGHDTLHSVTVASVQTLCRTKRLERFHPEQFGLVIVDEGHHALSDSYQIVLKYFAPAKLLLVTATPDRGDKRNLGMVAETIAYDYSLRDAIADGFLSKIVAETVPLKIDLSKVKTVAGDFAVDQVGDALEPFIPEITMELAARCKTRKTVVFTPLCATARTLRDAATFQGMNAFYASGDYRDDLAAYEASGPNSILFNSMLLTEGWDCPSVDCISVLRPTKVRSLYAQMIGRGTRIHPGKDNLLIVDFLWLTTKHELIRPASLITDKEDVVKASTKILEAATGQMDLFEMEEIAETSAKREREDSLARQLKENAKKKGRWIDPVAFCFSIAGEDLTDYEPTQPWEWQDPSEEQMITLTNMGFKPEAITSRGMAAKLMDRVLARRAAHLASPKQVMILQRNGYKDCHLFSQAQASELITKIAYSQGWQGRAA